MKVIKKIIVLLIFLTFYKLGFGFGFHVRYVSIDSLDNKYLTCLFNTKFKQDSICLFIRNQKYQFYQNSNYDITKYYSPRCLTAKLHGDTVMYVKVCEIEKITSDSIYTTLKIDYFNGLNVCLKKTQTVKNYGIAKNMLSGLIVTGTKKQRNRYYLLIGTFGVVISVLSLMFGNN